MMKSVVVIEDDVDILDMIKYILEDEKYEVIAYRDIQDINKISTINPSLILLDDRLANGYGSSLCKSLKSDHMTKHVPVILVSASPSLEAVAKNCQADDIIPKPFELEHLIKMVVKYSAVANPPTSTKTF